MLYFKKRYDENQFSYYASEQPPRILDGMIPITEEEYLEATTPTEEDIRAEKVALFKQLLYELYPDEEEDDQ